VGGAGRFSSNTSRMKMIDDDDVDTLTKLQQSNAKNNMTAAELRAAKRKRIMEKAAQRSGGGTSFGNRTNNSNKKQKVAAAARPGIKTEDPAKTTAEAPPQQQQQQNSSSFEDWQTLLRDRSNKMSGDDKMRVQRFFTTNDAQRSSLLSPSEGGPVYKMKIHEQRGKDPATGQEIKETFYLELNYDTGDHKQSKKVKRY
jgi:hypothetical protein